MTVRKQLDKVNVEALIDQGAKVKEELKKDQKLWSLINLRISRDMLEEVDEAVSRRVGITRTGWILEAIHSKIKLEEV